MLTGVCIIISYGTLTFFKNYHTTILFTNCYYAYAYSYYTLRLYLANTHTINV